MHAQPVTLAALRQQISRHYGESFPLPAHADEARAAYQYLLEQAGMTDPDGMA